MSELVERTYVVSLVRKIEIKKEQLYEIRSCFCSGKTLQEDSCMLHQAYTDKYLCDRSILQWHTAFVREGHQSAELIPHGGRPAIVHTEVNVNTVTVAIREECHSWTLYSPNWREECHSSTCKLAKLLNISRTAVNQILTENLAMQRVLLVWVPHFLTNTQMNDYIIMYYENLGLIEDVPDFLDHVITCDESWVHYFNPKLKQESSHYCMSSSSPQKKCAPAEIGGEGVHGGFLRHLRTHLSAYNPQESENCCDILPWGIATVATAYSNEEARVEASMDLIPPR